MFLLVGIENSLEALFEFAEADIEHLKLNYVGCDEDKLEDILELL